MGTPKQSTQTTALLTVVAFMLAACNGAVLPRPEPPDPAWHVDSDMRFEIVSAEWISPVPDWMQFIIQEEHVLTVTVKVTNIGDRNLDLLRTAEQYMLTLEGQTIPAHQGLSDLGGGEGEYLYMRLLEPTEIVLRFPSDIQHKKLLFRFHDTANTPGVEIEHEATIPPPTTTIISSPNSSVADNTTNEQEIITSEVDALTTASTRVTDTADEDFDWCSADNWPDNPEERSSMVSDLQEWLEVASDGKVGPVTRRIYKQKCGQDLIYP